jgi:phage terminase large subunit-like protein
LWGAPANAKLRRLADQDDLEKAIALPGAQNVFRRMDLNMAAPIRELEKLIVSKKLAHGGNPVTRWMAANVAIAQDPAGNLKPAKDKSTERIDGIVATIMAIGRAMLVQEEPQPSYQMFFV